MSVDIKKFETEHGDIVSATTSLGVVVARGPTRAEFLRFTQELNDAKKSHIALENLARMCVVHPSRDEFGAMLEKKPGIGILLGKKVEEIAGMNEVEEAKKE